MLTDLLLQFFELGSEFSMREGNLPQTDKRAHDKHTNLDSPFALQNIGSHNGAMLSEYMGQLSPTSTANL